MSSFRTYSQTVPAYSLVLNEHNERQAAQIMEGHCKGLLSWMRRELHPDWEQAHISLTRTGSLGCVGWGHVQTAQKFNDACSSLGHRSNLAIVSCQAVFPFLLDSSGKLKAPMPSRDAAGSLCAEDSVRRFPA